MSLTLARTDAAPEGWAALARAHGSFYHEPAWLGVLASELGVVPHFVSARDGTELVGILPLGQVRTLGGRRRLVSLPFSYAAGPAVRGPEAVPALVAEARTLAERLGCRLELKAIAADLPATSGLVRVTHYDTYVVPMEGGEAGLMARFHADSTRRGIRKAEKEGVQVRRADAERDWRLMAELQEATSHGHGLPAPPRAFFTRGCRALQQQGLADLYIAEHQGRAAGAIVLWKGARRWIYAFGASRDELLGVRPNHLLLWTAIKDALAAGVEFDLGRAAPEQEGLAQFKRRWGGVPVPLAYDYWPSAGGLNTMRRDGGPLAAAAKVWSALPASVARAGSFLYRYLG